MRKRPHNPWVPSPYPPEWHTGEIQLAAYRRASWRCEVCGAQFTPGDTRHPTIRNADGKPLILTVHHLDGRPENCDWTNLLTSCQACHLRVQQTWKPGGVLPLSWDGPPAWLLERGLDYQENPQLALPGMEEE